MIAAVLLAAGLARRFGGSKLIVPLRGEPLVRHAVRSLVHATSVDDVWVVLGFEAASVREALSDMDVHFVEHAGYVEGLGSSIAAGVTALPAACDATVIALGDQPFIPSATIDALVSAWKQGGAEIVAMRYRGVPANPVLFARATFPELRGLRGDAGARGVVSADVTRVRWLDVDLPVPSDVDTREDLASL